MANPRSKPLVRGQRSKVSSESRLRARGLVRKNGALFSTKTGKRAGASSAPKAASSGGSLLDLPGDIIKNVFSALAPQDRLMKDNTDKIKRGLSGKNPFGK